MEYTKTLNFLGNEVSQPSHFKTKIWVQTNDDARGTYNTNSQIAFKTTMLKLGLCDYSDAYILVKETIIIIEERADVVAT